MNFEDKMIHACINDNDKGDFSNGFENEEKNTKKKKMNQFSH